MAHSILRDLNESDLHRGQIGILGRMVPLVLASASPRRRELLASLGYDFEVVASEVDEEALTVPDPWETAEQLALAKARAVFGLRREALVIGGDTVVALPVPGGGFVHLAKPQDVPDAVRMLGQLSDQEHLVITGVAVVHGGGEESFTETTRVRFRALSREEIETYVATGEPMDKAGAYAIQAGAASFVQSIEGTKSNVIGLPVERLEPLISPLLLPR